VRSLRSRKVSRRYVLDANALLAFFELRRAAALKVRHLIEDARQEDMSLLMSAINWGEVFYITWRCHGEANARAAEAILGELPIMIVGADRDRATRAAALKQKHSLDYAGAFAAELAIERDAWLVTADPEFSKVGKTLSLYSLPRHEK
jgi:predicted nucleic acid-binding protein